MTVYVFVSSTSQDLNQDCRFHAIQAVQLSNAVPICMETWETPYLEAVEVCRRKIEQESSHYLGIYAYRYGSVHPQLRRSFTEAEFDWALNCNKPMVVFIPNPTTNFAAILRCRAAGQSESETEAQEAFLNRIRSNGTYQIFDDVADLSSRVTRRVIFWVLGGLRKIAERESHIIQLGRKPLLRQFEDSLDSLQSPELQNVACFLIHGSSGYGHKEISTRLRQTLQKSNFQYLYCLADIGALWGKNSLAKLLEIIGSKIERGWVPASPELLAEQLQEELEIRDVVLEINSIQRFNNSLLGFIKDFWHPIVSAFLKKTQHQLVVLLTLEQTILPEWEAFLQSPPASESDLVLAPMHPVKLPELKEFTEKELASWLRGRLPSNDALVLVKTLMDETRGMPHLLYEKLREDYIWVG